MRERERVEAFSNWTYLYVTKTYMNVAVSFVFVSPLLVSFPEPVKIPHWVRGKESAEMILPRAKSLAILGLGSSVGTPPEGKDHPLILLTGSL